MQRKSLGPIMLLLTLQSLSICIPAHGTYTLCIRLNSGSQSTSGDTAVWRTGGSDLRTQKGPRSKQAWSWSWSHRSSHTHASNTQYQCSLTWTNLWTTEHQCLVLPAGGGQNCLEQQWISHQVARFFHGIFPCLSLGHPPDVLEGLPDLYM